MSKWSFDLEYLRWDVTLAKSELLASSSSFVECHSEAVRQNLSFDNRKHFKLTHNPLAMGRLNLGNPKQNYTQNKSLETEINLRPESERR